MSLSMASILYSSAIAHTLNNTLITVSVYYVICEV